MKKSKFIVLVAAILGAVSTFLPWVTISLLGQVEKSTGMTGKLKTVGIVMMILFAIAVIVSFIPMKDIVKKIIVSLQGILGAGIMYLNKSGVKDMDSVKFEYGFWLCFGMAIVIIVIPLFSKLIDKETVSVNNSTEETASDN